MAKYQCSICGANSENPQCWKHKPSKGLTSNSSLKRGSKLRAKKKSPEEIEENREEISKMWAFFDSLWDKLKVKRCWGCNIEIYGPNRNIYWDHCIEKSSHPELKYEEENMFFCCLDCHTQKGNGYPIKSHLEAINKAKIRFGI